MYVVLFAHGSESIYLMDSQGQLEKKGTQTGSSVICTQVADSISYDYNGYAKLNWNRFEVVRGRGFEQFASNQHRFWKIT